MVQRRGGGMFLDAGALCAAGVLVPQLPPQNVWILAYS
jgi:hypothetical protein